MQEVFEKIIEQLESKAFERYEKKGMGGQMVIDYDDAIEIFKQTAAEYNNEWIPCHGCADCEHKECENYGKV